MNEVTQLLAELEDQGCLLESPFIVAEALERNVRQVIGDFLENAKHCEVGEDEGTWHIPGNRLLKISANHPLLSECRASGQETAAEYVVIVMKVSRLENLRDEKTDSMTVRSVEEALRAMTNIVYGIDPPKDDEVEGDE